MGAAPTSREPTWFPWPWEGVLASPTSGQKSSPGLTAQQTAAKAEQNLNVALLGREAKKGQERKGFLWLPASCRGGGGVFC